MLVMIQEDALERYPHFSLGDIIKTNSERSYLVAKINYGKYVLVNMHGAGALNGKIVDCVSELRNELMRTVSSYSVYKEDDYKLIMTEK